MYLNLIEFKSFVTISINGFLGVSIAWCFDQSTKFRKHSVHE